MSEIPQHRVVVATRDGDTRVIGKDGKVQNVDAAAREAALKAADKAAPKPSPSRVAKAAASDSE